MTTSWTTSSRTYGPPRPQVVSRFGSASLLQRIRPVGFAPAKMEIRAPWSS
jgi:hypothetical protein